MKITKTYSIDENIYKVFDQLTNQKNINKSSFIEDHIKKFVSDNGFDFVDKIYYLRSDPRHTVTVVSQDNIYFQLSDGSKISKILFMQMFKEVETVNPNEFFNVPALNKLAESIKSLDLSKMKFDGVNVIEKTKVNVIEEYDLAKVKQVDEYKPLNNTIYKEPNRKDQALSMFNSILKDIESGDFKKHFKTSMEIQDIMQTIQDIETDVTFFDPEYQELKYKVLNKVTDVFLGRI